MVVRVERVHDAVDGGWSDGEWGPTFSPHAHLEALLQPAVLALVAMVLVHRAVAVAPARVAQVPTYAPLEETFTPYTGERKNKKMFHITQNDLQQLGRLNFQGEITTHRLIGHDNRPVDFYLFLLWREDLPQGSPRQHFLPETYTAPLRVIISLSFHHLIERSP